MVSSKIKYSTYGAIISFSLITLSVSATNTDGIFGDYFRNIINDADSCGTNTAIT
jgi:hypothetical protein